MGDDPGVAAPADTRSGRASAGLWAWRAGELGRRALGRYFGRSGPRLAAAVAYYVLLSLFPIVVVIVAVAGAILTDASVREDFVDALVDALPLTEAGADSIDAVVRGVGDNAGAVGAVSAVGLLWTASGMMAALRGGLDDLTGGTAPRRPFLQGKLVDLLMLIAAGLLLVASAGITIADRVAQEQVVEPLGLPGIALQVARFVLPTILAFGVLVILLRWVPSDGPRLRDLWPAALAASVALWMLTLGFAFFVDNFGNYNVIYGSLAAVILFLVYIYVATSLVFMAAAFAADRAEVFAARPQPGGPGFRAELRSFLRSLVVRG
jgi:membrane protein